MTQVVRHPGMPFHRHYMPRAEAQRAHTISLGLLLFGIPGSLAVWQIWSLIMLGPGHLGSVLEPRYVGWAAVAVALPGILLAVAVAAASLGFAAMARRADLDHSEHGLWWSTGGLVFVLAVVGTVVADTVSSPHSATLNWVVRGAAVLVASAALLVAEWWARTART